MNWTTASAMVKYLRTPLLYLLLLAPFSYAESKAIPSKPGTIVNDYAGVLTRAQHDTLEEKLRSWDQDSSSTQIAIVIEKSLEGADLWTYCQELFNSWGIGQSKKNNGVLVYVALDEKRIRIHTGRGAEQFLGDARASLLIEEILQPAFRNGDYYGGLNQLSDRIMALSRGEYTADGKDYGINPLIIFLILFAVGTFLSFLNRNRNISRKGSRGYWGSPWNWPGGGFGGFGGGGWSGDRGGSSWGGFGGGSSGGGGASGSW